MPVSGQGSQGSAFPCTVLCQRPIAENQNPKSRRLQAGGPGSHLCPGFLAEGGLAPRECSPVSSPTQEQHLPPEVGAPLAWAVVIAHLAPRGDLQARGRGGSVGR